MMSSDKTYIVYWDVILLVNLVMDYGILWFTQCLCGNRSPWWRRLLGAIVGSAGTLLLIRIPFPWMWLYFICAYGVVGFGMNLVAFFQWKSATVGRVFRCYAGQIAITFILGGTVNWLYYYSPWQGVLKGRLFLLLAAGLIILTVLTIGFFRGQRITEKQLFAVGIRLDQALCQGMAYVDTGNLLRDPMTRKPVAVVDPGYMRTILAREHMEDYQELLTRYMDSKNIDYGFVEQHALSRVRWIPYVSVGEQKGDMLGIQCQEIWVGHGRKRRQIGPIVMGVSPTDFGQHKGYQLLLPAEYGIRS